MKKKYEVVVNSCYGGFSISKKALLRLRELEPNNKRWWADDCVLQGESYSEGSVCTHDWGCGGRDIPRHHPLLLKVVKELKKEANGYCSDLEIVKLDGEQYLITEYDGLESVEEPTDSRNWVSVTDIEQ